MDISDAESEIMERLERMIVPGSDDCLWNLMVDEFSERGTCDGKLLDLAENEIRKYLKGFKKKDIFAMWLETDVGTGSDDEIHNRYVDDLRMDVEMELLGRITDAAGRDRRR